MTAYLMALLLFSPMVTEQKIQWDTLSVLSLHIAAGANVGSSLTDPGPELGVMGEYLIWHPVAIRVGAEFDMSKVKDVDIGRGSRQSLNLSAALFTYKGRNNYFIYIGAGGVYNINWYQPGSFDGVIFRDYKTDSIFKDITISDADMSGSWGYMAFMGGRYKEKYSFEIGFRVTEPDFVYLTHWPAPEGATTPADIYRGKKISTLWVRIGYIFTL